MSVTGCDMTPTNGVLKILPSLILKQTFAQYPAINTNYSLSNCTNLQYNNNNWHGIMNSTVLPSFHFGMNHQGFTVARPACLAYDTGRKSENSYFWKDRIIVASTCRRSEQFGCYVTWVWMGNYVYVMTRMLHFYKFTISRRCRRAWKTSRYARE